MKAHIFWCATLDLDNTVDMHLSSHVQCDADAVLILPSVSISSVCQFFYNTSQLLSNSCCACRDAHHCTFVLTQPSTLISIGHGWATVQSVQTLLPCCSIMGQTCQSRISRQAHEPNCVQTSLAVMLFQAA